MRRQLDAYFTAPWQVRALLANQEITGNVVEPCSGDGSISNLLVSQTRKIITNDVDPDRPANFHFDAASSNLWDLFKKHSYEYDWVVTNPPYTQPICLEILDHALKNARVGVAFMLRISFDEPTRSSRPKGSKIDHPLYPRGRWLEEHPISRRLVLPRYSFTGDGHNDSTTTVWFIWLKDERGMGRANLSLHNAHERYAAD